MARRFTSPSRHQSPVPRLPHLLHLNPFHLINPFLPSGKVLCKSRITRSPPQKKLYTNRRQENLTSVVSGDLTIVNPRLPPPTSSRGSADKNSPVSLCWRCTRS